jgi:hypothetical protein
LKRIRIVKTLLFVLFMESIQPASRLLVALPVMKSVGSRKKKRKC